MVITHPYKLTVYFALLRAVRRIDAHLGAGITRERSHSAPRLPKSDATKNERENAYTNVFTNLPMQRSLLQGLQNGWERIC